MVDESELEGFRSTRYFARSWALLTRDRGWIKPVLLLTLALVVPIVGWLGVMGYIAEWARLTAWGVNSAPKQRGVRIGECIASGWRAFVVMLVWGLCMGIISGIAALVPIIGGLAAFAWTIFSIFLYVVIVVAVLRATIYQKIGAGLRVRTIWEMVSRDAGGLMHVLGIQAIGAAIMWVVCMVVLVVSMTSLLPQILYLASYVDRYQAILSSDMQAVLALQTLGAILSALGPAVVVLGVVCGLVSVVTEMIVATAVGLWMRQFDVASWGRDEDPLPGPAGPAAASAQSAPVAPGAPSAGAAPVGAAAPVGDVDPNAPWPKPGERAASASDVEKDVDVATDADAASDEDAEKDADAEKDVEVVEVETVAVAPDAAADEAAAAPGAPVDAAGADDASAAPAEPGPVDAADATEEDESPIEDHNAK